MDKFKSIIEVFCTDHRQLSSPSYVNCMLHLIEALLLYLNLTIYFMMKNYSLYKCVIPWLLITWVVEFMIAIKKEVYLVFNHNILLFIN